MAFRQAGIGDADELRAILEIGDGFRSGVPHGCLHAADELVDDVTHRPLERHLPFDALRHKLELVLDILLEITVGGTAGHCPDRAHAPIGLVGAPLVQEHLARSLFGAGKKRPDHHRRRSGRKRLCNIAAGSDAAVGNDRDAGSTNSGGCRHHRGQLRDTDSGNHPGRADRPRPDADLDRVSPRIRQHLRCLGGRDVTGNDLDGVGKRLHPLDSAADLGVVTMGGVDDDTVAPGLNERGRALEPLVADRRCRRHA